MLCLGLGVLERNIRNKKKGVLTLVPKIRNPMANSQINVRFIATPIISKLNA